MSDSSDSSEQDEKRAAIIEKLKDELMTAPWSVLREHCERGALILVDAKLDLIDVAVAFAEDDTDAVNAWLERNELQRIEPASAKAADLAAKDENASIGYFLIIQPFVLLQESGVEQ